MLVVTAICKVDYKCFILSQHSLITVTMVQVTKNVVCCSQLTSGKGNEFFRTTNLFKGFNDNISHDLETKKVVDLTL